MDSNNDTSWNSYLMHACMAGFLIHISVELLDRRLSV